MQDLISMPLVGFPIIASLIIMGTISNVSDEVRGKLVNPIRWAVLIFSLGLLGLTTAMFYNFFGDLNGFEGIAFNNYEYHIRYNWVESLGIHWSVGLDALSFPMVWLTTLLLPVTIIATWNEKNGAFYHPLLLLMGGALIGVFVALDLFMFYVFWELTLIPMFFLILKWGGDDRKYAAQKFFIYTFTASVVMLLGLVTLYFLQNPLDPLLYSGTMTGRTFDIPELVNHAHQANMGGNWFLGASMQKII
ncbi:MAG: proton-conducting transporter membrane subunit, partial [Candidatus Poseidoniaceae archaeon]